jgi:hypothetical protein
MKHIYTALVTAAITVVTYLVVRHRHRRHILARAIAEQAAFEKTHPIPYDHVLRRLAVKQRVQQIYARRKSEG